MSGYDLSDLGGSPDDGGRGLDLTDLGGTPEASAAPEIQPEPVSRGGLWDAMTTRDLSGASPYDPLAQIARLGQFANRGNQQLAEGISEGSGRAGAALGRAGFEGLGENVNALGVAAAGTLGTASEFLLPQNRLGVAANALSPLMKAYQAVRGPAQAYSKPGVVAQLGQARTKVPAADIQQAINDPTVWNAPSVAEANAAYGMATPAQGVTRSLAQKLDKTILGEADYTEAINRAGRILKGTEVMTDASGNIVKVPMDPQSALEGVQSINRFLKNKAFTSKLDNAQIGEILDVKNGLMNWMENNGSPGLRAAASVVRKAHVRDNLGRFLPQNKFGGNDAMRTLWAGSELGGAAALTLAGQPLAAVPLATGAITASPAVWGGAIRNYQAVTNPQVVGQAGIAVNAGSNFLADHYRAQQQQTALAEHYQRNGLR